MQHPSRSRSQRGFTLLEIMFVIIVMAIMAVSGVSLYNHKIQNLKVEKAATQIQEWLSGAINYYNAKGYWPGESTTNQPSTPSTPRSEPLTLLVNEHFLSGGGAADSHGNYPALYTPWSGSSESSIVYEASYSKQYFGVQATFPNATIAREVASRLPNWEEVNNDPKTIRATIASPGLMESGSRQLQFGTITLNSASSNGQSPTWQAALISAPKCANGWYPYISYTPANFHSRSNDGFKAAGSTYGVPLRAVYMHVVPYNANHTYIRYLSTADDSKIPTEWALYGYVEDNTGNSAAGSHGEYAATLEVNVTTSCVNHRPYYMNPNYYYEAPPEYTGDGSDWIPPGIYPRYTKPSQTLFAGGTPYGVTPTYGPSTWTFSNKITTNDSHGNATLLHQNDNGASDSGKAPTHTVCDPWGGECQKNDPS